MQVPALWQGYTALIVAEGTVPTALCQHRKNTPQITRATCELSFSAWSLNVCILACMGPMKSPTNPMSLRIYNTLSRTTEDFTPLLPGHVRMYVCGMTVYDLCHLGHARSMVAFDVAQRWLKASGYAVTYVRNITDIDDKIIKRALERGITIRALTDEMIAAMHQDIGLLGIEPPSAEPRATEYVPQMLSLIGQLEGKGLAYRASNGDVNYSVRKFDGYGKLSGKSP